MLVGCRYKDQHHIPLALRFNYILLFIFLLGSFISQDCLGIFVKMCIDASNLSIMSFIFYPAGLRCGIAAGVL